MKQNARQNAIIDIITHREVSTQSELTFLLKEQGFNATQATVSRDICDLHLIKIQGSVRKFRYAQKKADEKITHLAKIFKETVLSIVPAQNLLVIKTYPGNANSVAALVDGLELSLILGTISGDDTFLIITKDAEDAHKVEKILKEYL